MMTNRWRPLWVLFVALCVTAVHAEDVTPSDRVASRLNVREQPSTDSPIVGKLVPGETATLIDSPARWYRIRLDNGALGYVSKAWSEVVATAARADASIRIGTWNLKKLGHGST